MSVRVTLTQQTLRKRKAATMRQDGTMDDVEEPGTVTTHTCAWEHLAVVRGRNLLREKGCGLAAISGAAFLQGGFEIKQALPNGFVLRPPFGVPGPTQLVCGKLYTGELPG